MIQNEEKIRRLRPDTGSFHEKSERGGEFTPSLRSYPIWTHKEKGILPSTSLDVKSKRKRNQPIWSFEVNPNLSPFYERKFPSSTIFLVLQTRIKSTDEKGRSTVFVCPPKKTRKNTFGPSKDLPSECFHTPRVILPRGHLKKHREFE